MLFDTTNNGQSIKQVVQKAWVGLGGTVSATVDFVTAQTSYRSEVQKITQAQPDVIFTHMITGDAGVMFANMKELNGLSIPVVGDDQSGSADFASAIGLAAAQKALTSIDAGSIETPGVDSFNTLYQKLEGHLPLAGSSYTFDMATMFALAMVKANSTDAQAIVRAIPEIENPKNQIVYTFAEGLAALKAGKDIKFIGVSGPLNYNNYHNVSGPWAAYQDIDLKGNRKVILNLTPDEVHAATPASS